MPKHARAKVRRKLRREPVLASLLAPVVIWVAARFGLDVDRDTATYIAGVALAAAAWYARSRVTPLADPQLPADTAAGVRALTRSKGIDR